MSKTAASFDAIRGAIETLWSPDAFGRVEIEAAGGMLLLRLPTDVAAFAVFNGDPDSEFLKAYHNFKNLYRENSRVWDERTLSFVACRSSQDPEDDKFYAALETDPLFCRKYVIRAHETVSAQREELLRLPFLPLPANGEVGLQRPQPAQDLLQSVGIPSSFARNLIEPGKRSADRIALDLRDGRESLPAELTQPRSDRMAVTTPRATSRLVNLTIEGFRAYREAQTFDLDASVIVLYGPNGLGKTSMFDAIDYACTGRIGRLCRTRRSQTEFARIATHLDKTPGSGSVVLTVRGDAAPAGTWKLQRSTGDWGTAWIDGQEIDRKSVINKLTQATWLDTAPRQQTLESLFRATHLFGQDEQELLTEFRKGSIIPEAFISEMLSLQDYSEGVAKIEDVLSKLSDHRATVEEELTRLRDEDATLASTLTGTEPDTELTPVEAAIASLRQEILDSSLQLEPLPEVFSVDAYTGWHDVALARSASSDERVQLAHTCRDELPTHHGRVREQAEAQIELDRVDQQLAGINGEAQALGQRDQVSEVALRDGETQSRQLRARREQLRSASEALSQRNDLSKQTAALIAERDRQILERSEIDSRQAPGESALSKAIAAASEAERAAQSDRNELAKIRSLLDQLPRFAEDSSHEAEIRRRSAEAQHVLREAEGRRAVAEKEVQTARQARELLEPDYQRAVAAQAEIETLLDSIQGHISDECCPLCGSKFESVESLRESIARHRGSVSRYSDTTARYQMLVGTETQSGDRLRVAVSEVVLATQALEELVVLQKEAAQRLQEFRARLTDVLVDGNDAVEMRAALERCQNALDEQLAVHLRGADEARLNLAKMQSAQAEDTAKRKVVQERIKELERAIQDISDQSGALAAKIEASVPEGTNVEATIATEIAAVDKSIEETSSDIQHLLAGRNSNSDAVEALNIRRQTLSERRAQIGGRLQELNQAISEFRQKLRTLGVHDDGDKESLSRVIHHETERSDTVRAIAAKGLIVLDALRARETRRRLIEVRQQLELLTTRARESEQRLANIRAGTAVCASLETLLKRQRQSAIERHIGAYGPLITMIQQRLRSVYGFGGVQLEARGGEAKVRVEWRSKSVQVPPTDFFSDSQKQILMLSIFMAGGLRQNWSGFAPVLLDDPVTHFDDLNAYAFVELLRGIVATSPNEWQFVVSTCEQRLFDLMRSKFARLSSGAIFYQFVGMTEKGPIVERR